MSRKQMFAANWKMNKTLRETEVFCHELLNRPKLWSRAEVVIFPPFTAIQTARDCLKEQGIFWGAQDVYTKDSGAFTGEISPVMLQELGCRWVLVGHSERRHILGEKDDLLAQKVQAVLKAGLRPNLCIGETEQERDSGRAHETVLTQMRAALAGISAEQVETMVLSYEPVWAIGTGKNASSTQAEEMCSLIRKELANKFGNPVADKVRILYGGSVKPANIKEFTSCPNVDGALIGGASLEAKTFHSIIESGVRD